MGFWLKLFDCSVLLKEVHMYMYHNTVNKCMTMGMHLLVGSTSKISPIV